MVYNLVTNPTKLNLPKVMTLYSEELDRIEKKTPEQMLKVELENEFKFSQLYIIYVLFLLFWIVDLLPLARQIFPPFEIQIAFHIISIALIGIIYHKVAK